MSASTAGTTASAVAWPIRVAGVLFVVGGVLAVVRMALSFRGDVPEMDPGVIVLPVGVGILVGRPTARGWGILLAWVGLVFSVLFAVGGFVNPSLGLSSVLGVRLSGPWGQAVRVGWPLACALLFGWMVAILRRPRTAAWFLERAAQRRSG